MACVTRGNVLRISRYQFQETLRCTARILVFRVAYEFNFGNMERVNEYGCR